MEQALKDKFEKLLFSCFWSSDKNGGVPIGKSYIFPNGKFLGTQQLDSGAYVPGHWEVEYEFRKWFWDNTDDDDNSIPFYDWIQDRVPELSHDDIDEIRKEMGHDDWKAGSPFLEREYNVIRCNSDNERYVVIPSRRPTDQSLGSFRNWLDYYFKPNTESRYGEDLYISPNDTDYGYMKVAGKLYDPNESTSDDVVDRVKRYYSSGKLFEGWVDEPEEGKTIYTTTSPYDVASRMKASQVGLRILWGRKNDRYYVCDIDDRIHGDMADAAFKDGYMPNISAHWQLDSYLDEYGKNVMFYIYAPKGKEDEIYGSKVSQDGYEGQYVYDFGTVTTRADDRYKSSPLAKVLGKYNEHYIQSGWKDEETPNIIRVECLDNDEDARYNIDTKRGTNNGQHRNDEEVVEERRKEFNRVCKDSSRSIKDDRRGARRSDSESRQSNQRLDRSKRNSKQGERADTGVQRSQSGEVVSQQRKEVIEENSEKPKVLKPYQVWFFRVPNEINHSDEPEKAGRPIIILEPYYDESDIKAGDVDLSDTYPDFLTGTSNKKRMYAKDAISLILPRDYKDAFLNRPTSFLVGDVLEKRTYDVTAKDILDNGTYAGELPKRLQKMFHDEIERIGISGVRVSMPECLCEQTVKRHHVVSGYDDFYDYMTSLIDKMTDDEIIRSCNLNTSDGKVNRGASFILPRGTTISVDDNSNNGDSTHTELIDIICLKLFKDSGAVFSEYYSRDYDLDKNGMLDELDFYSLCEDTNIIGFMTDERGWIRINTGSSVSESRYYCVLSQDFDVAEKQLEVLNDFFYFGMSHNQQSVLIYFGDAGENDATYYFDMSSPEDICNYIRKWSKTGEITEGKKKNKSDWYSLLEKDADNKRFRH